MKEKWPMPEKHVESFVAYRLGERGVRLFREGDHSCKLDYMTTMKGPYGNHLSDNV